MNDEDTESSTDEDENHSDDDNDIESCSEDTEPCNNYAAAGSSKRLKRYTTIHNKEKMKRDLFKATWKSLYQPVKEMDIIGKWYGMVYITESN